MKFSVIGGGPGGLYFSILLKKARPDYQIDVYERNGPDDAFGFGVVFSDETLSEFFTRDLESYERIRSRFAYWDELDVARDGEVVRISGNGFCGCSRKTLLNLLQDRCREVGVGLHFQSEIADLEAHSDSDVVVACDGIGSGIRTRFAAEFGTKITLRKNRFVWLGSTRPLDAFTYFFRSTPFGGMVAHTYQYEEGRSTWIFEMSNETWEKAGFQVENEEDTIRKLSDFFAEELHGHGLITNKSHWRQFPHVTNDRWHHQNIVLLGDAKATAHYSIGSGTKLAMECAIALADSFIEKGSEILDAFNAYEKKRRTKVERIQEAATVSLEWFESMDRHFHRPFMGFAFAVMTRARKVTFENLRIRDSTFTQKVLAEFNSGQGNFNDQWPAAFSTFRLRKMELPNRVVMSPMGQYKAELGLVNDWHLVHYGARATGGVGLILTEMTAISAEGRITKGCAGIWNEEQGNAWKRIVDFVHQNSNAKIGIQLGHCGRKGGMPLAWEGWEKPLTDAWPLMAASAIPYSENRPIPKEMDEWDMEMIVEQFVEATRRADEAGFDAIELQAHHGFLLASFLSPLTNHRKDEFGGSVENRLKFPMRVFMAMRAVFSESKPILVRLSACDWADGGISETDVIKVAQAFKNVGADALHISSGGTVSNQKIKPGPMWQTAFSDLIRNTINIPTLTVGGFQTIDQVNTALLNGRADLVALGKTLLADPSWVRTAQAYEQIPHSDPSELGIALPYRQSVAPQFAHWFYERKSTESMKRALKPVSHKP
jgi:anthraniloyl-CoA monooxygenase